MGALVLDFLLVIVFLMMVPIGFFRGGLRELSTSAGLLLGILMAGQWAQRWSSLPQRMFDMSEGASIFLMGAIIAFGITGFIGYGGSAAFAYTPGPGGRLYGAFLALMNGMVAAGFIINLYSETIAPTVSGEPITSGIVARSLSSGFGSILLVATIGVAVSTIFGMFVRERTDTFSGYQVPTQPLYQPNSTTRPYRVEEEPVARSQPEPVRIREVEMADLSDTPSRPDPSQYGSGWRQTWPGAVPDSPTNPRTGSSSGSSSTRASKSGPASASRSVLADWVKDQKDSDKS